MQNVGIPILALAIVLGRWLLQNVGKAGADKGGGEGTSSETEPQTSLSEPEETEEERMRRFMEALGLPAGSVPPPTQPLRREWRQTPPSSAPSAAARRPVSPKNQAFRGEGAFAQEAMSASPKSAYRIAPPPPSVPLQTPTLREPAASAPRVPLRLELREPGALRKAFILREIFGPPKALQSTQQSPIFSPP